MVGRFRLTGQQTGGEAAATAKMVWKRTNRNSPGAAGGNLKRPQRLAAQLTSLDDDEALRNF